MAQVEIELKPVDFITVGTIGPKGKRVFHLQAGKDLQIVSLIIEKEQAWALGDAIRELIEDISQRTPDRTTDPLDLSKYDMELREPITPVFRVAQMALGYDDSSDMVVLVAQEMIAQDEDMDEDDHPFDDDSPPELPDDSTINERGPSPGFVRLWCKREQVQALSQHAISTVRSGRVDAKQNGRLTYYWM
jgi:uncharacterized repeat protein (TIGR03847 family)